MVKEGVANVEVKPWVRSSALSWMGYLVGSSRVREKRAKKKVARGMAANDERNGGLPSQRTLCIRI